MIGATLGLVLLGSSGSGAITAHAGTSYAGMSAAAESANLPVRVLPLHPDALRELIADNSCLAPKALLGALAQENLPMPSLYELLLLAERARFVDPKHREELSILLLMHARSLRDLDDDVANPPLWTAIRRFASLAPPESAVELDEFLRPNDSAEIRQSALLGIYSILELRSLPESANASALRSRLTELTHKYLDPDWLVSGQNTALALGAFTAAVLTEAKSAPILAEKLRGLGRTRLLRRAVSRLEGAVRSRHERGLPVSSQIHQIIDALNTGPSA